MDYCEKLFNYLVKDPGELLNKSTIKKLNIIPQSEFERVWNSFYMLKYIRQIPSIQKGEWNYSLKIVREGKLKEEWLNESRI